jgi:hypothetical protein
MQKRAILALMMIMSSSMATAFADDSQVRELCEISLRTCQNLVDNLQRRIVMINDKIRKGDKEYSAEEMKKLEQKLNAAMEQLDKVEAGLTK